MAAVYYRFVWNMNATGGEFPVAEAAATLLLTLGGAVSSNSQSIAMFNLNEIVVVNDSLLAIPST